MDSPVAALAQAYADRKDDTTQTTCGCATTASVHPLER